MKVRMTIEVEVGALEWANNNNGEWPHSNVRKLEQAVRQDVKTYVQSQLDNAALFDELDAEVTIR